jgi:hypothetical protein
MINKPFTAELDIQTAYKKYFTLKREFADDNHLRNWITKMWEVKGWKVIGVHRLPS